MTATQHGGAGRRARPPTAVPVRRGAPGRERSAQRPTPRGPRERASAIPGRGTPRLRSPGANHVAAGATSSQRLSNQLAGPADDLVPVTGHPPFQPGVTRVLPRGRPYSGPVRASRQRRCGPGPGSPCPSPDSGRGGWCSSSTRQGPYRRARPAQIRPADSVTEVRHASLSDNSPGIPGEAGRGGPDTQVPGPLPAPGPTPGTARNGSSTSRLAQAAEGHPRRRASVLPSVMVVPGRQRGTSSPVR